MTKNAENKSLRNTHPCAPNKGVRYTKEKSIKNAYDIMKESAGPRVQIT